MSSLACSTLVARGRPLLDAFALVRTLGFDAVDVCLIEKWSHPDGSPSSLNAEQIAEQLGRHHLKAASVNAMVDEQSHLNTVLDLAKITEAPIVTVAAPKAGTPPDTCVRILQSFAESAAAVGVTASTETHVNHATELPDAAVRLAESVHGLGLTLDPGHFIAGPAAGVGIEQVYPFVRQLHVRDAGRGLASWQLDFGTGEIDFAATLAALRRVGFDGPVSVEYIAGYQTDVGTNTVRARKFLERLL
jgi:sugar phosphate isomerase/epimerase